MFKKTEMCILLFLLAININIYASDVKIDYSINNSKYSLINTHDEELIHNILELYGYSDLSYKDDVTHLIRIEFKNLPMETPKHRKKFLRYKDSYYLKPLDRGYSSRLYKSYVNNSKDFMNISLDYSPNWSILNGMILGYDILEPLFSEFYKISTVDRVYNFKVSHTAPFRAELFEEYEYINYSVYENNLWLDDYVSNATVKRTSGYMLLMY